MMMGFVWLESALQSEYISTEAQYLGGVVVVELSGEIPFGSRSVGDLGNSRDLQTLQIIDFEPLLQNHKGSCQLENLIEGILDQGKGVVKILWSLDHGKAMKWSLGTQNFRKS